MNLICGPIKMMIDDDWLKFINFEKYGPSREQNSLTERTFGKHILNYLFSKLAVLINIEIKIFGGR